MRTVNRLLVRVASRHRAKAAACRPESSRRAQKTTIIFMHLWRQSRQTAERVFRQVWDVYGMFSEGVLEQKRTLSLK